jgi:hypothetical protein
MSEERESWYARAYNNLVGAFRKAGVEVHTPEEHYSNQSIQGAKGVRPAGRRKHGGNVLSTSNRGPGWEQRERRFTSGQLGHPPVGPLGYEGRDEFGDILISEEDI